MHNYGEKDILKVECLEIAWFSFILCGLTFDHFCSQKIDSTNMTYKDHYTLLLKYRSNHIRIS